MCSSYSVFACQREYYRVLMEVLVDFDDEQEIKEYAETFARDCYEEDADLIN